MVNQAYYGFFLIQSVDDDKWKWSLRPNGISNPKSAYYFLREDPGTIAGHTLDWRSIWKLNVPPKVKKLLMEIQSQSYAYQEFLKEEMF